MNFLLWGGNIIRMKKLIKEICEILKQDDENYPVSFDEVNSEVEESNGILTDDISILINRRDNHSIYRFMKKNGNNNIFLDGKSPKKDNNSYYEIGQYNQEETTATDFANIIITDFETNLIK